MLDGLALSTATAEAAANDDHMERSWSRMAESFVRTAQARPVAWHGLRLASHFQPIYCVRRARCVGYEALARATDENARALAAREIFAATPLMRRSLLDWVLRALHLRSFARFDPGDRTLHLNVHSSAALTDLPAARDLAELIRYYGLSPARVCIEMLDTNETDMTTLREAMAAYRSLGATVAYADILPLEGNLERMLKLRPPLVKIDVAHFAADAPGSAELAAAVRRFNRVGTRVAIEGIENAAAARLAVASGADYLQGFHFGQPVPALPDNVEGLRHLADALGRERPLSLA
jgi:EAL domain-containing protein (putative c-di-GMP-specific phosphodiesterase class I)